MPPRPSFRSIRNSPMLVRVLLEAFGGSVIAAPSSKDSHLGRRVARCTGLTSRSTQHYVAHDHSRGRPSRNLHEAGVRNLALKPARLVTLQSLLGPLLT